jgi:hypothetical protein
MGQGEAGAITAVFFGDGAACEGIFHEAINLAVTWQLPPLRVREQPVAGLRGAARDVPADRPRRRRSAAAASPPGPRATACRPR